MREAGLPGLGVGCRWVVGCVVVVVCVVVSGCSGVSGWDIFCFPLIWGLIRLMGWCGGFQAAFNAV